MKQLLWRLLPLCALVFLGFAILYPNPFGNSPDVIADESYFLTSSLSAIEKTTLPGWEFSPSGNYYGGLQTYLDTAALVPVIAASAVSHHFSLLLTKAYIATHSGELLHVLRLLNGLGALVLLVFLFFFFKKRDIPVPLTTSLTLFLCLLLGNALFIQFLHTAKVWTWYALIVAATSSLFFANEYYLKNKGEPFIAKKRYAAILIWAGIAVVCQAYIGLFSILLLALYSWLLGHIEFKDFWGHVRTYWLLIIAVALTQISFVYRAYLSWFYGDFSSYALKDSGGTIEWTARFTKPLMYTVFGDPLSLLYIAGLVAVCSVWFFNREKFSHPRTRIYVGIAVIHPVLVYLFFHVLVGLNSAPRYGIILSLACAFSVVIMAEFLGTVATRVALALAVVMLFVVNIHAIQLYWHPSSETVVLHTIETQYNSADTVFIEDASTLRLALPVNGESLKLLDKTRAGFGRFQFLLAHPELLGQEISFKPITVHTYTPEEESAAIKQFSNSAAAVWVVTSDCARLCSDAETASGRCFEVHIDACGYGASQEVNILPEYMRATSLGSPYIVRRVH